MSLWNFMYQNQIKNIVDLVSRTDGDAGYANLNAIARIFKVYLEDTGDGVEVGVAGITVRPAHQIDDVLDLVLVHEVPQTHNLEVPGLSPGWSTLKIKHLQSFCRCFFFYR